MFAKDFIEDRYYGPMFTSLFLKRRLESVMKVFMSKEVLANLKISVPIDA